MTKLTLSSIGPLLREKRGNRGIREVASEIGISSATLSRVENGKFPDLDTFSKMCRWLQIDPSEVLGCKDTLKASRTSEQNIISVHLRTDRTQDPEVAQALTDMILKAQDMISEKQR